MTSPDRVVGECSRNAPVTQAMGLVTAPSPPLWSSDPRDGSEPQAMEHFCNQLRWWTHEIQRMMRALSSERRKTLRFGPAFGDDHMLPLTALPHCPFLEAAAFRVRLPALLTDAALHQ
jgi:hypothetical protein